MLIETLGIGDLKPYEKNAKTHPKKQVDLLAENITRFGFTTPVLVDKDNNVIAGHGRLLALKQLGKTEVPCVRMEHLSDEEVKALRLADNKIAELGEWDMDLAIEELKGLDEDLLDLTGFDSDLIIEPDEKDDEVPDVPEEPVSVLGDLYELGEHRVLCGDSTKLEDVERLMDGKKADMVFTDPPYGMSVVKGNKVGADFGVAKKGEYGDVIGDDTTQTAEDFYNTCVALGYNRFIIWGGNYFLKFLPFCTGWIIWDKRGDSGIKNTFADGEMAWTNVQRQVRIYKQLWNGMIREGEKDKRLHTTQKPIMTLEKILGDFTKEGETIFDGFLGSGSTLIASEKTGRICFGMELSEKYCDVIVSRYVEYTGNNTIRKNGEQIVWETTKK